MKSMRPYDGNPPRYRKRFRSGIFPKNFGKNGLPIDDFAVARPLRRAAATVSQSP
jgi:hypothetical protein